MFDSIIFYIFNSIYELLFVGHYFGIKFLSP